MDPNAGRFTIDADEIERLQLTSRLGVDEVVEIKGVRFRVLAIDNIDGRGQVVLRMLSKPDRDLIRGGGFAVPEIEPQLNRHERRARAAERRMAKR